MVGYIPKDVLASKENPFEQLVAGVMWIVRQGRSNVAASLESEYRGTQEGNSLEGFTDVTAARVAIGHDAAGNIKMVQIDGKTWERGVNLYQFSEVLLSHGLVNAINLDGGGSATTVVHGQVVSVLSDGCDFGPNCSDCPAEAVLAERCDDWCGQYHCARKVTTIVCAHGALCDGEPCEVKADGNELIVPLVLAVIVIAGLIGYVLRTRAVRAAAIRDFAATTQNDAFQHVRLLSGTDDDPFS